MDQDKLEPVPQAMMDEMTEVGRNCWPASLRTALDNELISVETPEIRKWYIIHLDGNNNPDLQLKLIKHIWLNEPQFKAEKPKKWIVRSNESNVSGEHKYLYKHTDPFGVNESSLKYCEYPEYKLLKFDTKEEAEQWTNPLMEAVEVEE